MSGSAKAAVTLTGETGGEGENPWKPERGQAPILLLGSFHTPLSGEQEVAFRGAGEMGVYLLPSGTRSFLRSLPEFGAQTITTRNQASEELSCREELSIYPDLALTPWDTSSHTLNLNAGPVEITENGSYLLLGSTDRNTIRVAPGVSASISMNGVSLKIKQKSYLQGRKGFLELGENSFVSLYLSGSGTTFENTVEGSACSGIYVPATSRLTVEGSQALTITPGELGAAIGVPDGEEAGTISLITGTVNCTLSSRTASQTLVGGKNAILSLEGASLFVTLAKSESQCGTVGGECARVTVSGGSLSLPSGSPSGALGGTNASVLVSGGAVSLHIGDGDIGVGGNAASVELAGGTVSVSDVGAITGSMASGVGGPGSVLRAGDGSFLVVDSMRKNGGDHGALGGINARVSFSPSAMVAVRMKQRENSPFSGGFPAETSGISGGFLDMRLSTAFTAETVLRFTGTSGVSRDLSLPAQYYGFLVYLPEAVYQAAALSGGSAGSAKVASGRVTALTGVSFDRAPGFWLEDSVTVYNGKPQALVLSGDLPDDCSVVYENNVQTQPGTYSVTAAITSADAAPYTLSARFTIIKAPLTAEIRVFDKAVYDGSREAAGGVSLYGAMEEDTPYAEAEFYFDTPDVGTGKPVTAENLRLGEEWVDCYELRLREGQLDELTASVLEKATAQVNIDTSSLVQAVGSVSGVSLSTMPEGLSCTLEYSGKQELPQSTGNYPVKAVVNDPNYQGSAQGMLVVTSLLDVSQGDVVLSAPGTYTVTGSTDTNQILITEDAARGGVVLSLRGCDISRPKGNLPQENISREGLGQENVPQESIFHEKIPLEIQGDSGYVKLLLPQNNSNTLSAGTDTPALRSSVPNLFVSGRGCLYAYGGSSAKAAELSGIPKISPDSGCFFFSTLSGREEYDPQSQWARLNFASAAPEDLGLALSDPKETRGLFLPAGYRSMAFPVQAGTAYRLEKAYGEKLSAFTGSAVTQTLVEGLPFAALPGETETIDLLETPQATITSDGTYRLTGAASGLEDSLIVLDDGLDVTLVLDGMEAGCLETAPALIQTGMRCTVELVCEGENTVSVGQGGFLSLGKGSQSTVRGSGRLNLALGRDSAAFSGGPVELSGEAAVAVSAQGKASTVFSQTSGLRAEGGSLFLELSGENSLGFSGTELALSGTAQVVLNLSGPGSRGMDSGALSCLELSENASFYAYTAREDTQCLTGTVSGQTRSRNAVLFCGTLEGGLSAASGPRTIQAQSPEYSGWQGSLTFPQEDGGPYRSFLMLLPGEGDYEFTCPLENGSGTSLSASARVAGGAASVPLSFQMLTELPGLVLAGRSEVYDGNEKNLLVEHVPSGAAVTYQNNGQTVPGTYLVTASVRRSGFRTSVLTGELEIEKRTLSVSASAQDKLVYDGSREVLGSIVLGNAAGTDAPTATGVFAFEDEDVGSGKKVLVTDIRLDSDEHDWAAYYRLEKDALETSGSILQKAPVVLAISQDTLSQEYGSVSEVPVSGAGELPLTVTYAGKTELPRLPGSYPVVAKVSERNHEGEASGILVVRKKVISVSGILVPELPWNAESLLVTVENSESFDASASGILPGDRVAVSYRASYPDLLSGSKTVAVTELALTGAQAGCYELLSREAVGSGKVQEKPTDPGTTDPGDSIGPGGDTDPGTPEPPEQPEEPELPFTDIGGHWALDDIAYMKEKGLMTGSGDGSFEPEGSMTRAMVMTVLFQLEHKKPEDFAGSGYADVPENAWYAPYIQWASGNGLAAGMDDGTFHPHDPVTREQLAAFLHRYAAYREENTPEPPNSGTTDGNLPISGEAPGEGTPGDGTPGEDKPESNLPEDDTPGGNPTDDEVLSKFQDAYKISFWAVDAIRWGAENGILAGRDNGCVAPQGTATRAEVAAIFHRYLSKTKPAPQDP